MRHNSGSLIARPSGWCRCLRRAVPSGHPGNHGASGCEALSPHKTPPPRLRDCPRVDITLCDVPSPLAVLPPGRTSRRRDRKRTILRRPSFWCSPTLPHRGRRHGLVHPVASQIASKRGPTMLVRCESVKSCTQTRPRLPMSPGGRPVDNLAHGGSDSGSTHAL